MCQQTVEYLVPCSTQSQFPYLWSAALHCTHGWRSLGTQERTKWAFPAAVATPGSTTGTDPHPKPSESRPPQPGFTQSRVRSRRFFSLSVHLREHNWEARPQPGQKPNPAPRHPRSPRPCTVQVPSQLLAFTPG